MESFLGCVFIRRHVKAIHPMDDKVELAERNSIALVESWSDTSYKILMKVDPKHIYQQCLRSTIDTACRARTKSDR